MSCAQSSLNSSKLILTLSPVCPPRDSEQTEMVSCSSSGEAFPYSYLPIQSLTPRSSFQGRHRYLETWYVIHCSKEQAAVSLKSLLKKPQKTYSFSDGYVSHFFSDHRSAYYIPATQLQRVLCKPTPYIPAVRVYVYIRHTMLTRFLLFS